MELRMVMMIARLLDPRRWKRRVMQVVGAIVAGGYLWMRAVAKTAYVRERRRGRWATRDARARRIRTDARLEIEQRLRDALHDTSMS